MGNRTRELDYIAEINRLREVSMKLTLFINSLYGGGAERVTCNLASYLAKKGHEVEILTMSATEKSYELDKRVSVSTLLPLQDRKNKIWNALIRFPRLWKYLRNRKKDAYIVMLPETTLFLLIFHFLTKAKMIAAERADPSARSALLNKGIRLFAFQADGWVFQTEDAKTWYASVIKNCQAKVIPNAINPAFIRAPYKGEKRKVIAGVGRLTDQKNFSLLISAFAKIADAYPDYTLTIYGQGEKENDLKKQVADFKLANRVCFPGNVQNIAEEMEKNAMFVLSSDFEGMPNALMEAMALGLPCVATDCPVGGPRYLIQNGENGLLVPAKDADALAKAMRYLLAHAEEMKCMGGCARNITKKLSPDKIYGEWESFVYSVIHK